MAINKPLENWTKFPNCILDNIDKYTANEFKILAFMVRKNEGYQDPNKMFSMRYIASKTKMSKTTVNKCLITLEQKKSIKIIKRGSRGIKYYDINWSKPILKFDHTNNWHISGS